VQKNKNITAPKTGMNRTTHPTQLKNTEYTYCMNCNTSNETGEGVNITNEPSNYFAVQFEEGYKVIGYEKHPTQQLTYFFLTNPETGYSSVGYVRNNIGDLTFAEDTTETCEGCNEFQILPTPLEETTQVPFAQYIEFFNDLCNKDLNFSVDFPIKHIEIKTDKLGTNIYWVDARNPDRVFDADNVEYYKYTGEIVCGVDERTPVCVEVEKMLQHPNHTIPTITPEVLQIGGNLRMGTYEYILAYSDLAGNEITNYNGISQPTSIFDANNRVLNQTELDSFTNYAIRLKIENLDTRFKYYKLVVIERVAVNQAESYFVQGIYPTTDDTILHTSTQTGTQNLGGVTQRISYNRINFQRATYEHTRGIESSNKQLFKWGLTGKKYPNLQPIVNIIGGFLKWNSSVAKEGLYKDAIATSLYKGYMREEVQPFGIRFFNKDGSQFPVMPLVPRPPKASEIQDVSLSDKNYVSVVANGTTCTTSDRSKVWQIYNTATVEGVCLDFENSGEEVTQDETSTCVISNVATLSSSSVNTPTEEAVTNLEEYVNLNLAEVINPASSKYIPSLVPYLTNTYPASTCEPNFSQECDTPTLQSAYVQVQEVNNAIYNTVYDENTANYARNTPAGVCQAFQQNNDGTYIEDTAFETDYALTTVYKRAGDFFNEDCINAISAINNNNPQQPSTGYFNNYYGSTTLAGLVDTSKTIAITNSNFQSSLHKGALWFKVNKNNRNKIILEIAKNSPCNQVDDISSILQLRYSVFTDCSAATPTVSKIIQTNTGDLSIIDSSSLPSVFYIAVEAPIVATTNAKYIVAPPCACYSVLTRDLNVLSNQITFDSIVFEKVSTYTASCTYNLPEVNECKPIPYQYGNFSYWESIENYPDNTELYDSSKLKISVEDLEDLSIAQKQEFLSYYSSGTTEGNYNLKSSLNLACKPQRFYKFPSNIVSPFMGTTSVLPFSESLIFPLGVSLDNTVVNIFLDVAVNNNLMTAAQRNNIAGYEILKGDNAIHKSIVSNSIGFDMYKYDEKGDDVLYANYPLNDLGKDILNTQNGADIPHPYNAQSNFNFSLLSPEFSLNKPTLPTEIIISGYQLGDSRSYFNEVEEHPKWILLTSKASEVALTLGLAESILEQVIHIAEVSVQFDSWVIAGVSTGTNAVGSFAKTAAIVALVAGFAVGLFVKTGQYRLQWLRIIRDLGQRRNYTSYCATEGYNNKFLTNSLPQETLRGVSSAKYLKAGRFTFRDEKNGEDIKINNISRESSTFVSTGKDYAVLYPTEYSSYDNNSLSISSGSRTIVSQNSGQQGEETVGRRSAMPYVTLKNYIPNQFGSVDSIKWLSTSYRKFLTEDTECEIIYGGTVFLCRDVQERKLPIFRTDAFDQADMTPFNYSRYKNIGTPKYFIDFEKGGESIGDLLFPNFDSDFRLDNVDRGEFYYRENSKFYLYYYGFASYLVESEINTNFRYGGREIRDQYFPDIQSDIVEFTQQKNRRITQPPTYYYNSVYSRPVTQTPYFTFPVTYSKVIYDKINDAENGVIQSLADNSENDLTDPWTIYLPLNKKEYDSKFGKLISLTDLGSETLLARFENTELLLNSIDDVQTNSGITADLGTGGVFNKRPLQTPFGGTQNTDIIVSKKYGAFSVDAKRGQIYQRSGQEVTPISDVRGQEESGMKQWFRQHLPFKILRYFPDVDIDNKFKSLGISMGLDSKMDRVFITKRDYIPVDRDNLLGCGDKIFDTTGNQAIIDDYTQQGYTYNGIIDCQLNFSQVSSILTDSTDIHAFFDTSGSFDGAGLQQVKDAMQSFYDDYVAANPSYTGTYYPTDTVNERWVRFISTTQDAYGGDTSDKDILLVSFTNEAASNYHNAVFTDPLTSFQIANYLDDYEIYLTNVAQFNSVNAVAYPIITTGASGSGNSGTAAQGKGLIVQTLLAMYGIQISEAEFNTIPQNTVFTDFEWAQVKTILVDTPNPYGVTGLYDLGWKAQYDVNDTSGVVITNERLSEDLTALIQGGTSVNIDVVTQEMPEAPFNDPLKFKDVSWTVAYSILNGSWVSYYSFKPDYYLSYDDEFYAGINYSQKEGIQGTAWVHNGGLKSFGVFFGELEDFTAEGIISEENVNKFINSITVKSEVKRWKNDWDFNLHNNMGFNQAVIYNANNNSGLLELNQQKSLRDISNYPKTNTSSQDILYTSENGDHRFNYFYNRVKNINNNVPIWNTDENNIEKTLNAAAISFIGKRTLERLRGNYMYVRLTNNKESRLNILWNKTVNEETI